MKLEKGRAAKIKRKEGQGSGSRNKKSREKDTLSEEGGTEEEGWEKKLSHDERKKASGAKPEDQGETGGKPGRKSETRQGTKKEARWGVGNRTGPGRSQARNRSSERRGDGLAGRSRKKAANNKSSKARRKAWRSTSGHEREKAGARQTATTASKRKEEGKVNAGGGSQTEGEAGTDKGISKKAGKGRGRQGETTGTRD